MHTLDVTFFYIAFWLYFAGFFFYSLYIPFRTKQMANIATSLMAVGLVPQTIAIIIRWITSDHVPLSNMYEYMSLMSWMAVLSLLILIWRYQRPLVGSFISPLVFMLMVTASLLPKDVSQRLVPALQSYWITIHVTLAALGSGTFVVACAVSFIYLMKSHVKPSKGSVANQAVYLWLACFTLFPFVLHILLQIFGLHTHSSMIFNLGSQPSETLGPLMISLGMALPLGSILMTILYANSMKKKDGTNFGSNLFAITALALLLSALLAGIGNTGGVFTLTERSPLRIFELFGVIMVLLTPVFLLCYYLLYVLGGSFFQKLEINLDVLDEINYKAITLGYPLYTVGALFAGAIWAEQAWGQFWSWDPKEVGSLIIWLFYSGFLHARYQRQWKGSRAAILAVFGFIMVLLSFFGNYFFGGQHAYA